MSVQPSIKTTSPYPFSKQICCSNSKSLAFPKQKPFDLRALSNPDLKSKHAIRRIRKTQSVSAAAELAPPAITFENSDTELAAEEPQVEEEEEEEVKSFPKPRIVLKFIWMDKNIGLGLDQLMPGYGTVPMSPYFFWPRKDAWEELKTALESKPWISQKKMIILLNQATDIINLWQQSGGNLS
ncbi:30S ribosomal protein 3-1- chloroplastic [Striga hermonthica]|uniref:30S ribosomal protein 3-1- chloroplastic n=1 Tax=Striga hermonthica TaxID=68872 RepID=A0A9N7NJK7_STRHE|nr:30S ribosomal protein 3-1- chloroplastic [Striga hermonthica]